METASPLAWADVTEERVVLRGRPLVVVRPSDAEALIDEERFARDEFLPYWAELWPSALALAEQLLRVADGAPGPGGPAGPPFAGQRVVELGCGLGLPSLAAALAGASVVASDWAPEALPFVVENARRNGVGVAGGTPGAAGSAARCVEPLECGWAAPGALVERRPFDLVLASDVLYERANVGLLAALLPQLVADGGEVLLADPGRPALPAFRETLSEAGWTIDEQESERRGPTGPVRLLRCLPPGAAR